MKQEAMLSGLPTDANTTGAAAISLSTPSCENVSSTIECFDPLQSDFMKETTFITTNTTLTTMSTTGSTALSAEQLRFRKKPQNILNRSDSTGSTCGRKYLAPTLSDPQAIRNDKYIQKKKTGNVLISAASSNSAAVVCSGNVLTSTRSQIFSSVSSSCIGLSTIASSGLSSTTVAIPSSSFITSGAVTSLPPLPHDNAALNLAQNQQGHYGNSHHHAQVLHVTDCQQSSPGLEGTTYFIGLRSVGNQIPQDLFYHIMYLKINLTKNICPF